MDTGNLLEQIKSATNFKERQDLLKCITNWHENPVEDYRTSMLSMQAIEMENENRDLKNLLIYNIEAKIHDFSKRDIHLCLKKKSK